MRYSQVNGVRTLAMPIFYIPPNSYAIAPGIIRPASVGEIRLTANDPAAPLHIDPRYLRRATDRDRLVHSLEMSIELMNGRAFAEWRKGQVWPRKTDRKSLNSY